jgi:hypothetical protein
MVHMWPKGSKVNYYYGSHLQELPMEKGRRSLYETDPNSLMAAGCRAKDIDDFEDGDM